MTTGYWWVGRANFGDLLTPLLMAHFAQVELVWAKAEEAQLVMVGSVLEHLSASWSGTVLGSGKLHEFKPVRLPFANILGVRGPLTARAMRLGDVVLGDPGLLANELVNVDKRYRLGIVPHWSDTQLEHRQEFRAFKPHIIRPTGDPVEVLREIGRCRKIVASSLHGIIVADAFGIPRRIEMTKLFDREGGDYKFRDHNAAVGVDHKIGFTQEAPRYLVQDRQHCLYDAIVELGKTLRANQ